MRHLLACALCLGMILPTLGCGGGSATTPEVDENTPSPVAGQQRKMGELPAPPPKVDLNQFRKSQ